MGTPETPAGGIEEELAAVRAEPPGNLTNVPAELFSGLHLGLFLPGVLLPAVYADESR